MARKLPSPQTVILRDWRSEWDGYVCKVLAVPRLERLVSPGEIAVFEPTGAKEEVEVTTELRDGRSRTKTVEALVYRRTGTRLM